jgi:hypothetical protein
MKIYTIALLAMVIPMTATADACTACVYTDSPEEAIATWEACAKKFNPNSRLVSIWDECGFPPDGVQSSVANQIRRQVESENN